MPWKLHLKTKYQSDSTEGKLASQRNFTRRNPDPYPVELVFDPEKLLPKQKRKENPNISSFQNFSSFSNDDIEDIEDISFDLKFEQSLFTSKSEYDFKEIVLDPNNFQVGAHNNSVGKKKASGDILWRDKGQHSNTFTQNLTFQNLGSFVSHLTTPTANQSQKLFFHIAPPPIMATRFVRLLLPVPQHDLPQNYSQRIRLYGANEDITTQQHLDCFNDFIDLEEVDYEYVKMRLFSQSFLGELKKWFVGLVARSIRIFQEFEIAFLGNGKIRKIPYSC